MLMTNPLRSLILLLSLLAIPSAAAAAPTTHEIIQKLSAESYAAASISSFSANLPKNWSTKKLSDSVSVFQVPYHAGVMGHIEAIDTLISTDEAVNRIQEAFKASFQVDSSTQRDDIAGKETILSGRLGGEIWRVLVFTGSAKSGKNVFFYAVA